MSAFKIVYINITPCSPLDGCVITSSLGPTVKLPGSLTALCSIPRTVFFWTEIVEVVPVISLNHFSSFGVIAHDVSMTTYTTEAFSQVFQSTVLLKIPVLLLWDVTVILNCYSIPTTSTSTLPMFNWLDIICLSVLIWRFFSILALLFPTTFGRVLRFDRGTSCPY